MPDRLGLRLRIALFFAGLALGGIAAMALGLWLAQARYGGPVEGYVLAGLVGGFALAGLAAWVGFLFDQNLARPILGLASDLETRARTEVDAQIDPTPARYLGALAPAAVPSTRPWPRPAPPSSGRWPRKPARSTRTRRCSLRFCATWPRPPWC